MKKKLLWIAALFAVSALIVVGCPTGGGDDPVPSEDVAATNVYFGKEASGVFTKIQDASLPLTLTENYVRIIFDPLGKDFQKIRVKFSLDQEHDVMQQCAFENDGEKGYTWGGTESPDMYLDFASDFTYERDPTVEFTSNWSNKSGKFDKTQMIGICFSLGDGGAGIKFTLNELSFVGAGKPSEPSAPPGSIDVEFKGTKKTATLQSSNFAKIEDGKMIVTWNPKDESGAFRAKVQFATDSQVDLSTGYSKFKMNWSASTGTSGSFNISLFFSGNRMLSKTVNSGTAEFNFVDDHPDWAAGTSWGGAAVGTITGFEIYSSDGTSLGAGPLVITNISFE